MPKFISFDMDGTLVDPEFTDWVWGHGLPLLYARKTGLSFDEAKAFVEKEYQKVGEGAIEWYDIKYWLRLFRIDQDWKTLMGQYVDKISIYRDADHILRRLNGRFALVLTSNAGREFIDMEMETTGIGKYFKHVFSATSDYRMVKKTADFYRQICEVLHVGPYEVVHVGDHFEFDYVVPLSIGIQAFYLDRSGEERGDFILHDLKELEMKLSTQ